MAFRANASCVFWVSKIPLSIAGVYIQTGTGSVTILRKVEAGRKVEAWLKLVYAVCEAFQEKADLGNIKTNEIFKVIF